MSTLLEKAELTTLPLGTDTEIHNVWAEELIHKAERERGFNTSNGSNGQETLTDSVFGLQSQEYEHVQKMDEYHQNDKENGWVPRDRRLSDLASLSNDDAEGKDGREKDNDHLSEHFDEEKLLSTILSSSSLQSASGSGAEVCGGTGSKKYSIQTIRQKKGRKLASTMHGDSSGSGSNRSSFEGGRPSVLTTGTATTTGSTLSGITGLATSSSASTTCPTTDPEMWTSPVRGTGSGTGTSPNSRTASSGLSFTFETQYSVMNESENGRNGSDGTGGNEQGSPPQETVTNKAITARIDTTTHAATDSNTLIQRSQSKTGSTLGNGGEGSKRVMCVGLYQGLGRIQAVSAILFASFTAIHLVPPVLASVGGVELANKALIWGRVYYQTAGVEQVLVYGSLAVHIGASLGRMLIRMVWKARSMISKNSFAKEQQQQLSETTTQTVGDPNVVTTTTTSEDGKRIIRKVTTTTTRTMTKSGTGEPISHTSVSSKTDEKPTRTGSGKTPGLFPYHRLVGWILTPVVLAHMDVMRLTPAHVFGDSSLVDYSLVTFHWRIGESIVPLGVIVVLTAYHWFGGSVVALNRALPWLLGAKRADRWRRSKDELVQSKTVRGVVAGVVTAATLVGVYRIAHAPGMIPMNRLYMSLMM
ncbi:hypothetical protein BGW38_003789 [Lunasporangiospora selenospora]|uniref:Uncharacterized protein n=1 Tax=Lunasporangiospora selenospora TaxID=979761 RepID=A0A9P6KBY9_9FUNG|nr:hypothetical protein BGW38_003789 [Lunasporangiospora selenospora]